MNSGQIDCLFVDIKAEIKNEGSFYQFADNINLLIYGNTEEDVVLKLQNLTMKMVIYLDTNQLALNYEKFQFLVSSNGKHRSERIEIK